MTKQREGRGSKRCILTTTFRSRNNKEESVGFSPEIVSTADYHMIHRTQQPVGAIYELQLMTRPLGKIIKYSY